MIIYKKHSAYDQEKNELLKQVKEFLNVKVNELELFHIYLFKNEKDRQYLEKELFDMRYGEVVNELPEDVFFVKDNDGQYNQIEDLTTKYINDILGIDEQVRYVKAYKFEGISDTDLEKVKSYIINPVVQKEIRLEDVSFEYEISEDTEMKEVEGFIDFTSDELIEYRENFGFDIDDLKFIQQYFRKEIRNPRYCELKMLDTYWSDHCRHTTFLTNLEDVRIDDGKYREEIKKSYDAYMELRDRVYTDKKKPVTLMDLATIKMRDLKKRNFLEDMEKSNEVNACSIEVDIEVNGEKQRWLHMFKNETHNHPTEIEPYGGAHTCIGGGIRDPLSGRAQVIQGIRIVGAGNPLTKYENTIEGKLSQRYLANMAMNGFSDYANQIGAPVGIVREFYDDGFQAKRMELGALVAAVPKSDVTREEPVSGDLILLLGAPTGRDGLGAAVGSSSMQTEKSLTKAGAEVQKGNPFAERKIIRLFNRKEATKLIKKSNDFGAGGVSVAIGELAPGLDIYLDQVYTKYPGLNGYEIALSESQERMAVVIAKKDFEEFTKYLEEEDVRYAVVAEVNDQNRLKMHWKGKVIIDLSRELLDSNGAPKFMDVQVETEEKKVEINEEVLKLNQAITKNITQNFDNSLGRNKVFMEYGGKNQLTQQDGIITKFPVENTDAVSVMTYGYYPEIAKKSTYHAGYYAVLQSITKNIALTGKYKDIRLTMQEFFPSIKADPKRMGLPFSALLGAFEVMNSLEIPAIGGKDSMSGTFKDIDVPPTIVSFAVNVSSKDSAVSREIKKKGTNLYLTDVIVNDKGLICFESFKTSMEKYGQLLREKKVLSASAISEYGVKFTLDDMAIGNSIGYEYVSDFEDEFLPGTIVFETDEELDIQEFKLIAKTVENSDLSEVVKARTEILSGVFEDITGDERVKDVEFEKFELEEIKLENPRVLIPVIDGATGEYDLERAMAKAGFTTEQFVIKTGNNDAYRKSVQDFANKIDEVNVLAIPHGDYMASVIKNISGLILKVLEDGQVRKAIENLIERKGFVIGIGAGMSALADLGLFGDIKENLIFRTNKNNKYVNVMQDVLVKRNSYVTDLDNTEYTAPISGRMITLECKDMKSLEEKVDILSVNENILLPYDCGIDSIQSKCGHVIGIRTLVDRVDTDLYKNIEIKGCPKHFEILRRYFK